MSSREGDYRTRLPSKEGERHPNVRFSMVQLDINENGLPQNEAAKRASASRKFLLTVVLCVAAAVILAIIAIAVGLALTGEARRAIGGQDGGKQPTSSTTLSSSSHQPYIPVTVSPHTPVISPTISPTTVGHSIIHSSPHTVSPTPSVLPSATIVFSTSQLSPLTSSTVNVSTPVLPPSTSVPPLPVCNATQFRCTNGECVPSKAVCDGLISCRDQSDEVFCPDCLTSGGFQCASGLCLWNGRLRCNSVFNCNDLSDELNCYKRDHLYQCTNGAQIPQNLVCNGVDDCYDNSDEIKCQCSNGRMPCLDGRCIMREWRCDGYPDCVNGTDEIGCNRCSGTEFVCRKHHCLNQSRVCDGEFDCYTGEDEGQCVHLGSPDPSSLSVLTIQKRDVQYRVCSDGWTDKHSHFICQHLDKAFQFTRFQTVHNTSSSPAFLILQSGAELSRDQPISTYFHQRSACPSLKTVALSCAMQECGARKVNILTPFVAGGNVVPEGKWPWVVSLSFLGEPGCAGALIGQQWVLTAGHCVVRPGQFNFTNTPSLIEVLAGSINRHANSSKKVERVRAVEIHPHPDLVKTVSEVLDWDAALVKLERPFNLSDFIQPVCLPYSGQSFFSSMCYLSGWGRVSSYQYLLPGRLRDAKMQVWNSVRCARNKAGSEVRVNTNSTLCAGYMRGLPTGCEGDSGGPLMCRDGPGGPWALAGIMSSGSNRCENAPSVVANRFTNIAGIQHWIQSTVY